MRFSPILWTKEKADGTRHLKIYIGKDRKVDFYNLNIFIKCSKLQSNYLQWVPSTVSNHQKINAYIKIALDKFNHLHLTYPNASIKEIKNLFDKKEILNFYEFYEDQFDLRKKKIKTSTARTYNQLKACLEDFAPELGFDNINYEFLSRFEGHMKDKKLLQTTIYKRMTTLKMWVNEAARMGKISVNPFHTYKLKNGKSNRSFLSKTDLKKITEKEGLAQYEKDARERFLFQCYTGLSYSDLIDLKWSEIKDNAIHRFRLKTNQEIIIPLIEAALEILNRQEKKDGNVFKKITNQKYNHFLHSIEARIELPTSLTSHVARHTFATLALDAGISMPVVSSILGHSNIHTTQIYGKITKSLKEEELKKLKF